jgi:hypothetical protein
MRAYDLVTDADMDLIREEELKMKGHRRVFDGAVGKYVLKAQMQQSAKQKMVAIRTERRRLNDLTLDKKVLRVRTEHVSGNKRKALLRKSEPEKAAMKDASKKRKEEALKKRLEPSFTKTLTLKQSVESNLELKKLDESYIRK